MYFCLFWTTGNFVHVTIQGPGHVTVPDCISQDGILIDVDFDLMLIYINSERMGYNIRQLDQGMLNFA